MYSRRNIINREKYNRLDRSYSNPCLNSTSNNDSICVIPLTRNDSFNHFYKDLEKKQEEVQIGFNYCYDYMTPHNMSANTSTIFPKPKMSKSEEKITDFSPNKLNQPLIKETIPVNVSKNNSPRYYVEKYEENCMENSKIFQREKKHNYKFS